MLPMPKKLIRATRGNDFWDIVKKTVPKLGYRFNPQLRGENLFVVIKAMDMQGIQKDVSYPVPRIAKDFRTVFNYKSQLTNFLRDYMAENRLVPLSAELRPARTVIQHRPEPHTPHSAAEALFIRPAKPVEVYEHKKAAQPLPPPIPLVEEQPVVLAEVQAAPLPVDEVLSESPQLSFTLISTFEELESMMAKGKSNQVVLATFAGPIDQLTSMVELTKGSMKFVSAVSATGVPVEMAEPAPTKQIKANGANKPRRKNRPAFELQSKFFGLIRHRHITEFSSSDFKSITRDPKAIGNTLAHMMRRGYLKRTGRGMYTITTAGIKEAKQLVA